LIDKNKTTTTTTKQSKYLKEKLQIDRNTKFALFYMIENKSLSDYHMCKDHDISSDINRANPIKNIFPFWVILLTQGEKCKVMFFCPPWQMKCLMN
jgi:hypothetical protein